MKLFGRILLSLFMCCAALAITNASYAGSQAKKPLAVVVGRNKYSEITDFLVPYSILSAAGGFDVLAVSTAEGPINLGQIQIGGDITMTEFDRQYKRSPDIIVVPAMADAGGDDITGWLNKHHARGTLIVSVCEGVRVLAEAGLLDGKQATGYVFAHEERKKIYPGVRWLGNTRYVDEGSVITASGISSSAPVSLMLVERYLGKDKARELAKKFGVNDYSADHDTSIYPSMEELRAARMGHQQNDKPIYQVKLASGVNEYRLAFALDLVRAGVQPKEFLIGAAEGSSVNNGYVLSAHGLKLYTSDSSSTMKPDWTLVFGGDSQPVKPPHTLYLADDAGTITRVVEHIKNIYGAMAAKHAVFGLEMQLDEVGIDLTGGH